MRPETKKIIEQKKAVWPDDRFGASDIIFVSDIQKIIDCETQHLDEIWKERLQAEKDINRMSLRDEFAMRAPEEIPSWFPRVKPEKPEEPVGYWDMQNHPDYREMKNWHTGETYGHINKTPELQSYMDQWTLFRDKKELAQKTAEEKTYFNWRWYYADAMLKERDSK